MEMYCLHIRDRPDYPKNFNFEEFMEYSRVVSEGGAKFSNIPVSSEEGEQLKPVAQAIFFETAKAFKRVIQVNSTQQYNQKSFEISSAVEVQEPVQSTTPAKPSLSR
jgi:hypothetical protein